MWNIYAGHLVKAVWLGSCYQLTITCLVMVITSPPIDEFEVLFSATTCEYCH